MTAIPIEAGEARIAAADLVAFMAGAFEACGLPRDDADASARAMTQADLEGVDTHGCLRLPDYVGKLRRGAINPGPRIAVERRGSGIAIVDGDNGMGHLAAIKAAETAVALARETGIAWVGVRRSNHAGAGAVYAAIPVASGMVGLYAAVSGANFMAPWGAREPLLGTNPIAIGIPAGPGRPPVMVDVATSTSSFGQIKKRAALGLPLDPGWMRDRDTGESLTDPARLADGILAPIGGYKGAGIALALGILAGPLNGAAFGRDLCAFDEPVRDGAANAGQFVVALDIARFMPAEVFGALLDRHLDDIRALAPLPGGTPVRVPGDGRAAHRATRERDGIPISGPILTRLREVAAELGLAPPRLARAAAA